MKTPASTRDEAIWRAYGESYMRLLEASRDLFSPEVDRVAVLRGVLERGGETIVVAHVLPFLSRGELEALFPWLVRWCAHGHGLVHVFRDAIKSLSRDWVLARIEKAAEPLLAGDDDEHYQLLLELYEELDRDLTRRLAERAIRHENPHIREAGEDAIDRLRSDPPEGDGPGEGQTTTPERIEVGRPPRLLP